MVISATRPGYISPRKSAIALSKLTHAISTVGMISDIAVSIQYTRSRRCQRSAGPSWADDSPRIERGAGGSWKVVKNDTPNR